MASSSESPKLSAEELRRKIEWIAKWRNFDASTSLCIVLSALLDRIEADRDTHTARWESLAAHADERVRELAGRIEAIEKDTKALKAIERNRWRGGLAAERARK